jgi:hypothetical protein
MSAAGLQTLRIDFSNSCGYVNSSNFYNVITDTRLKLQLNSPQKDLVRVPDWKENEEPIAGPSQKSRRLATASSFPQQGDIMKRSSSQQLQIWGLLALGGAGVLSRPMLSQLSTAVMLRNIPSKAGRCASLLNYCLSDRQALSVWGAVCPSLVVGEVGWGKYDFMYFRIDFSNNCK